MIHVNYEEYLQAKKDIIEGNKYTEYSNMDEYGRIHKQYVTENNGTFYEVNDNGKIEFWSDKEPNSRIYEENKEPEKIQIGMGHMIRAMQMHGFGHAEIMAMRKAMENGDMTNIEFCEDCYTEDWKE